MAKWDQRDPRWIVEVRPDGTNVNNWHWVEKNATTWSKNKITELLCGLVIQDDEYFCEITEVTKLEGEATANNRKAKLIFFYEWDIKADWSGKLKSDSTKYKGKLDVPNLSEENDEEDLDVNVSVEDSSNTAYKVKEFMRCEGTKIIQKQLGEYIKCLKEEYSQGIILPTKDNQLGVGEQKTSSGQNLAKQEMNRAINGIQGDIPHDINDIPCKTLKVKEDFICSVEDLYRALTTRELMSAFTNSEVVCETDPPGNFSLYSGFVTGQFLELVPSKKIVQKWRLKSWPEGHYSEVTIELDSNGDTTTMNLTQKNVPEKEFDNTQDGWSRHYWARIKQIFGYGAQLF